MSNCNCEKQDRYANCCMRKRAERERDIYKTALNEIIQDNPDTMNDEVFMTLAYDYQMIAHTAIKLAEIAASQKLETGN